MAGPAVVGGLLLVSGSLPRVRRWAATGLIRVEVAPLDEWWTALVPVAGAAAADPYDEPWTLLINRPIPWRLRPAIGVLVHEDQTLIVVTPKRPRGSQRWLAWRRGIGAVEVEPLPRAALRTLLVAADRDEPWTLGRLREVLDDPAGSPLDFACDVLDLLDLPGQDVVRGRARLAELAGAERVEADPARLAEFDQVVADERANRSEVQNAHTARPLGEETAAQHRHQRGSERP